MAPLRVISVLISFIAHAQTTRNSVPFVLLPWEDILTGATYLFSLVLVLQLFANSTMNETNAGSDL